MTTKIIAEIGINHNGDINIAKQLITIASASGCDYVKIQKRNPDVCVPEHQKTQIKDTPWGKMSYLEYKIARPEVQNTPKLEPKIFRYQLEKMLNDYTDHGSNIIGIYLNFNDIQYL